MLDTLMDVTPPACCRSERVSCEEWVVFAEGGWEGIRDTNVCPFVMCFFLHSQRGPAVHVSKTKKRIKTHK